MGGSFLWSMRLFSHLQASELEVASGYGVVLPSTRRVSHSKSSEAVCSRLNTRFPALWAELCALLPARRVSCDAKIDSLETSSVCSSEKIQKKSP